jgi:hypothetical protein
MELGIIHRASTRNQPPAPAAGAGSAQAAAQTIPCGERMANPPADAIPGAITHDNQTEGYYMAGPIFPIMWTISASVRRMA